MRVAEAGIQELQACVDTLIVIPNQNLFRIANEKTTFADAFAMADQVLYSGVACITDLMVKEGLINLDFADVRSVMREMGKAMMGTGEASGDRRAIQAAEAAIANPLLDETSMKGARGLLISITGGKDLTLFEVDEAATRIREEVDPDANIILGATFEEELEGIIRVSVVATGIDNAAREEATPVEVRIAEMSQRLRSIAQPQPTAAKPAAQPAVAQVAATGAAGRQAGRGPGRTGRVRRSARPPSSLVTRSPLPSAAPRPRRPRRRSSSHDAGITIAPLDPAAGHRLRHGRHRAGAPRSDGEEADAPVADEPFIPPQPKCRRSACRGSRISRRSPSASARRPSAAAAAARGDRGPMSLLRRLASVGLGRREDDPIGAGRSVACARAGAATSARPSRLKHAVQPRPAAPAQPRPQAGPAAPQDGLYRPRAGNLDPHGRPLPREGRPADDELEIPAFLRRQAN